MKVRTTIVARIISVCNLTLFTCPFTLILTPSGFLTLIVTMIQNPVKEQFIRTLPAIVFIRSSKSLTPQPTSSQKVKNIDKRLTQKVKRDIVPSSTAKWASLNAGTTNKTLIKNNKSNNCWRLSIGRSLEVDSLNMMKAVPTMMTSLKIFKLVYDSSKRTSTITLGLPFQLIPSVILNLLWLFSLT